jgi:lipopolysaccharide transport system permease protein
LLYFLTLRDIKVRYKQTLLGILWIVLQPFISVVIFTIIFGNFAKIPSDNIPYPIFVFVGLFFWNFFSSTLTSASNSLISNQAIIKKVYFPKILAPLASSLSNVVDLIPYSLIFIGMMLYYKYIPSLLLLLSIPLMLVLIFMLSISISLFLSPFNARFRDVRHALPFFIRLGFFATPVIYSSSLFGDKFKYLNHINPVANGISIIRNLLSGERLIETNTIFTNIVIICISFFVGLYFFRIHEEEIVDIL